MNTEDYGISKSFDITTNLDGIPKLKSEEIDPKMEYQEGVTNVISKISTILRILDDSKYEKIKILKAIEILIS